MNSLLNIVAKTGLLGFLLLTSCGKETIDLPCSQVLDLSGKAVIVNTRHEFKDVFTGMMAPIGSQITVAPASRIVMGVNGITGVTASENTVFSIDSIIGSGAQTSLSMRLFDGKLLCSLPTYIIVASMPMLVTVRLIDRNASLILRSGKGNRITVVKTIGGSASITVSSRPPLIVPACCKALVNADGFMSRPIPLNEKDFSEIALKTSATTADSIINNAACPQTMLMEKNLPPQWEKSPNSECMVGKEFMDTLAAKDPEGSPITYTLIEGPKGMLVDAVTGIVSFLPKKAAVYSIKVAAIDSTNLSANMTYSLSVTAPSRKAAPGKFYAVINAPGAAAPGEPVVIDASHCASAKTPPQSLSFRFDINGNGKWEYPSSGGFGKDATVTHAFKNEGSYVLRVEVKNGAGKTAIAKSAIMIRAKPIAKITVSPQLISVNKECVLDAGQSVTAKACAPFEVRWDLDNNGTWDFPANGGYSTVKTVKKTWNAPGTYSIVLEIKDRFGAQAWASAEIEVKPAAAPLSRPKPDTAAKPKNTPVTIKAGGIYQTQVCAPLTLEGSAQRPNGKIVSYAWDFDGKGAYDTSSTVSGKAVHTYRKSGTFRAVFKVTTDDKKDWFDTATVMVLNSPPVARAGKDFLSKKGKKITLKGTGEDPDDGIALYEWDFNNDGVFDWSSPKNGEVDHVFDEYSHAVLRVTDRNGASAKDTLRVVICPEGMVSVEQGLFCIDEYEWPNKKGLLPDREMTFDDAWKKCAGAGKRLCSGIEWEKACAGEHNRQYPKSNSPPTQNCNVIGNRAFSNKIAPSGSFSDCASPAGAYDMNGNVAEWTAAESSDNAYVYGGSWHNDLADATCSSKLLLKKNKGYFYVGFRCCK